VLVLSPVAAAGQETALLPGNIPADLFAFDPRYTQARFVVVNNLWRNWGMWEIVGVSDMLHQVQAWPLVFEAGEIEVYANPDADWYGSVKHRGADWQSAYTLADVLTEPHRT
jgi:hypothetical protein